MRTCTTLALLCFLIIFQLKAQKKYGEIMEIPQENASRAGGCASPTSAFDLQVNNVRARLLNGGDMWWDLLNRPVYEVPLGSGIYSMFAGCLWVGGMDAGGNLKIAANRYRSGDDFWPGPLSTISAEIDSATCDNYDRHYSITRTEVQSFIDGNSPSQNILDWPAHGRNFSPYDEGYYLAPFVDVNGDGEYKPSDGDYPAFDMDGSAGCDAGLFGDQSIWWIMNDKGNAHTNTGSDGIGLEVHAQAFAYATNNAVNNMTFYHYKLINRSSATLFDTWVGKWADPDVGNYTNDYIGCDVMRRLGYGYTATLPDQDFGGAKGYGYYPTSIGITLLAGPKADPDGLDNPQWEMINGSGYDDGVIDNEQIGMNYFMYQGGTNGNPTTGPEYYNLLRGRKTNGERLIFTDTQSNTTVYQNYFCPGNSDSLGWGYTDTTSGVNGVVMPEFSEIIAGNQPGDRRFIMSSGPFTLEPGGVNEITLAVVWAQTDSGMAPESAIDELALASDLAQKAFDNCFAKNIITGAHEQPKSKHTSLFPNPFSEQATLKFENPGGEEFTLTIYNLQGAIVQKIDGVRSDQVVIKRNGLPTGVYYYNLLGKQNNQNTSGKFILSGN